MNEKKLQEMRRAEDYFTIRAVDAESNKRIITIGNKIASPVLFENEEAAQQAIDTRDWDLILSLIFAACDARDKAKENIKKEG